MEKDATETEGQEIRKIEINRDFCKGCRICVEFCPKGVLELDEDEKAVVAHPEKCNFCNMCELRCPDMAVELTE